MKTPSSSPTASETGSPSASTNGSSAKGPKLNKLVVAVHGIGKQFRYATIQSVAGRFGTYCRCRVGVPLGNFHSECENGVAALRIPNPPYPDDYPKGLVETGFAEIFWADIPDEAVKKADTIEETKAWARTVIERVRALDRKKHQRETVNYEKAGTVVEEMVETIGVLESLLFLGKKCGVCTFDLQQLLTDYVGDIQIVTEFANYRSRILAQFHNTLRELHHRHDPDEIHIVAHSEGTVVAFLGLLEAMSTNAPGDSAWVNKVIGFMTIGSPIDKHLIMWPNLWEQLRPRKSDGRKGPIRWFNYYDHGDPVGFELDTARQWLIDGQWMGATPTKEDLFHFTKEDEYGFTRYLFPGKAHNDYWADTAVFDHFIGHIVDTRQEKPAKPSSRAIPWAVSWILPYAICFLILLAGTYFFYKPVSRFIDAEQSLGVMAANIFAIGTLFGGMTVMARVPRLAKCPWRFSAGIIVFVISVLVYQQLIAPSANAYLGLYFTQQFGWRDDIAIAWVLGAVGVLAGVISYGRPQWGLKPLVVMLGLVASTVVWGILYGPGQLPGSEAKPPIWPVVLGVIAFLYLWWLAALLFDLVFVWHRYIRSSRAVEFLRTCDARDGEGTKGMRPDAVDAEMPA